MKISLHFVRLLGIQLRHILGYPRQHRFIGISYLCHSISLCEKLLTLVIIAIVDKINISLSIKAASDLSEKIIQFFLLVLGKVQ